jgi:hypothetical protein
LRTLYPSPPRNPTLTLYLSPSLSRTLDFIPGLRERIKTGQIFSGLPVAPARSFPHEAAVSIREGFRLVGK